MVMLLVMTDKQSGETTCGEWTAPLFGWLVRYPHVSLPQEVKDTYAHYMKTYTKWSKRRL